MKKCVLASYTGRRHFSSKLDLINVDRKEHLYRLTRKKISKLYMEQSVNVRLDQGYTRSVKTGREIRIRCRLSPTVFGLFTMYLTEEALGVFGDFRIGGKLICTV
jgi:hypothetical protein